MSTVEKRRSLPASSVAVRAFVFLLAVILIAAIAQPLGAKRRPRSTRSSRQTAQVHRERSQKESELARLQSEIEGYKKQLREHEQKEKRSRSNLSAFNRRTEQLKAAIARLEDQIDALSEKKTEVDSNLRRTASSLDQLKNAYATSSRYLYEHGQLKKPDPNLFLFAPEKQSQYNRNSYYAHAIGEAHAMNRDRLDSMKRQLGESSRQIASTLTAEEQAIGQQSREAETLEQRKAEEAKQLDQIKQNKERLQKLLKQRMASAKRLEGMIANLVAKEEAAKRSAAAKKRSNRSTRRGRAAPAEEPEEEEPATGRSYGPHSLAWPCASHHVKQGFGEHRNAELNTVTMNLGIDIATQSGSAVTASADGEVSLVSSLPSYGTIVVLKHSGGLHTVYADLSGANVRVGSKVRAGQVIGRSGANEENGPVLHFEVWKGKAKQNPMGWLR